MTDAILLDHIYAIKYPTERSSYEMFMLKKLLLLHCLIINIGIGLKSPAPFRLQSTLRTAATAYNTLVSVLAVLAVH